MRAVFSSLRTKLVNAWQVVKAIVCVALSSVLQVAARVLNTGIVVEFVLALVVIAIPWFLWGWVAGIITILCISVIMHSSDVIRGIRHSFGRRF